MTVAIVGCGHVGSTTAFAILMRGITDRIVLTSRSPDRALGEAADLRHAAAFVERPAEIVAGPLEAIEGASVVVITASVPTPTNYQDRNSFAPGNVAMFGELIPAIVRHAPDAVLLIVSNPVDVMTYYAIRNSGLAPSRVIGSGTLLDSGRFRQLLSGHLGVHPDDIRAYILGEHGSSQFPALSVAVTGGQRFDNDPHLQSHFEIAKRGGEDVFALKGHTNFAIALANTMIVESILRDSRRTLPVSTLIDGYQGVRDVCLSVPAIIGRQGIIRQLRPELSLRESDMFRASAAHVRGVIEELMDR
jgi:L-lactate dehydrogenase